MVRKYGSIYVGIIRLLIEKMWNLNHLKLHGIHYYFGKGSTIYHGNGGVVDLGKKTWIDRYCYFSSSGLIKIGYNNFFNSNIKVISMKEIVIGDNNLFGPNVVIVDHDHRFDDSKQLICKQGFTSTPVKIGSNIWVGANVLICQGVSICDRVVVAGNAVVTKSITEPGLYSGIPARKLKDI